jgi:putative hemolysin/PKD repeat protein
MSASKVFIWRMTLALISLAFMSSAVLPAIAAEQRVADGDAAHVDTVTRIMSMSEDYYYVAPDGDDANPGSYEAPWARPGYASRQLKPGDTLVILGGRYVLSQYDDDIITPPAGTADAWITIKGEEDSRPILAGRDNLLTAITLAGVSFVRLENLEITHDDQASGDAIYFRDGVEILWEEPASHIVLKDLYIHHIDEFGLNVRDVDDLKVIDCRIEYCGFGAMGGPEADAGGWRNVLIQGCDLSYSGHYYQGGDGSNRPYDRPDGFGVEPSGGPVEIVDTVAQHNYGDGLDSKVANTSIRRCIVANNSCDGIKLWGDNSKVENTLIYGRGDGDDQVTPWAAIVIDAAIPNCSFEIVNLTVDDTLGHNYIMYVCYDHPDVPINLLIRNTIFRAVGPSSSIFISGGTSLAADHNLFYLPNCDSVLTHGGTTYTSANIGNLGEGNIYGDPLFVAPAWGTAGNYHLGQGSPATDAATTEGAPLDDLEGHTRDTNPNIGAYEQPPDIALDKNHLDFDCSSVSISNSSAFAKSDPAEPCASCSADSSSTGSSIGTSAKQPCQQQEIPPAPSMSGDIGLSDPAAVYCTEMGYEYKVLETEQGETGVCVLPDGTECDAWAFYGGECGEDFSYCARKGLAVASESEGDSFAAKCTTCVLPDGSCKTVSELLGLDMKCTLGTMALDEDASFRNTGLPQEDVGETPISLPSHFDWRDKDGEDWMTPVKSQGSCGSCWAFSAVGTVEAQFNIFYGNPDLDLDLSEQYLVSDCCTSCGDCSGGWHNSALGFIRDWGITDEACFRYIGSNWSCSGRCADWSSRLETVDETGYVGSNIETIRQYLVEKGPLAVAMRYGGSFGADGIYRCNIDSPANHAVVIVGYDETENYWIVRNSWGSGWNGDGYFKVGCGECSIENYVYYANLISPENCQPILVSNEGDSDDPLLQGVGGVADDLLVGDIEIGYEPGEPTGWLDANPKFFAVPSGSSQVLSVCVDCAGLGPNEYHGWLDIRSNDPDEDPYRVTVTLMGPGCTMAVSPVTWSPTIACGQSDSEIVTVSATGDVVQGVTVSKTSGPDWLGISPTDLGDIPAGSSKTFTLTASPPADTSGGFSYAVQVTNTHGFPSCSNVTGTINVGCCSIHLESAEDDAATLNKGTVTFDGIGHSLPTNIFVVPGSYIATYNPEGIYEFQNWEVSGNLSVSDPDSQTTTVVVDCGGTLKAIYMWNHPPTAAPGGPYTGTEDAAMLFDGSGSYDPEGDPLTYSWDFGDGSATVTVDTPTVQHTYTTGQAGVNDVYTVSLIVNDGTVDSDPATTTATVTGVNDLPIADPDGPYTGTEDAAMLFDGSGCYDPEGSPLAYSWDFGDGSATVTVDTSTVEHTYTTGQAGVNEVYTVSLIVNDGTVGSDPVATTATITGVNDAPIADADGPYSASLGQLITFDATGSSDEEGPMSYRWDFGDGSGTVTVDTPTVQHSYNAAGTYEVTLVVEDRNGARDTDTTRAGVTAEPVELFIDSFEDYYLSNWVQDSQNDWFCSPQRAVEGSRSAEVDGWAQNASLTLKEAVNLSEVSDATLSFSWLIESGVDSGEYLALDLWDGTSWNEAARLRGDVDLENVWHNEVIELGSYLRDDFKLRFRGKMSATDEDANVDLVRIVGSPLLGPGPAAEKLVQLNFSTGPQLHGAHTYQFGLYPELDARDFMGPDPLALAMLKRILTS